MISVHHKKRIAPEIEQVLIAHCGPVLFGLKPAAMFRLPPGKTLSRLTDALRGLLKISILRRGTADGALIIVYDKALLEQHLFDADALALLTALNYPAASGADVFLAHLKRRFAEAGAFPHEVGLFLGYPPEDVAGFMQNQGQRYKLCGMWKVYGDVERARDLFCAYHRCRDNLRMYFEQYNNQNLEVEIIG